VSGIRVSASFHKIPHQVSRLGLGLWSGPHVVGRLWLRSRVVGRLGSGVWVRASFQMFALTAVKACPRWGGKLSGRVKCPGGLCLGWNVVYSSRRLSPGFAWCRRPKQWQFTAPKGRYSKSYRLGLRLFKIRDRVRTSLSEQWPFGVASCDKRNRPTPTKTERARDANIRRYGNYHVTEALRLSSTLEVTRTGRNTLTEKQTTWRPTTAAFRG